VLNNPTNQSNKIEEDKKDNEEEKEQNNNIKDSHLRLSSSNISLSINLEEKRKQFERQNLLDNIVINSSAIQHLKNEQ
jgi:hypothetical protein